MAKPITVQKLFGLVGLELNGPVQWGVPFPEKKLCGVYAIATVPHIGHGAELLPREVQERWIQGQPIVYIGRTKRALSTRIHEFYRHERGAKGPHRGGQDVKLLINNLKIPLWIFWSTTEEYISAENNLLNMFSKLAEGTRPFANRIRSSKSW